MNYLYIIDKSQPYKGSVLNTMPFVEVNAKNGKDILNHTYVHYSDETFADYNAKHGGNLVALTWDELYEQHEKPHLIKLQGEFQPTTEERFWDGLECLPPKRWTRAGDKEFFFVGECYTADLYTCYVRLGQLYYTALRGINTSKDDIFNLKPVQP